MNIRKIVRFTAQIAKTENGPLENAGHFADVHSAELWALTLLYTHEAVSATVVPIQLAAGARSRSFRGSLETGGRASGADMTGGHPLVSREALCPIVST